MSHHIYALNQIFFLAVAIYRKSHYEEASNEFTRISGQVKGVARYNFVRTNYSSYAQGTIKHSSDTRKGRYKTKRDVKGAS